MSSGQLWDNVGTLVGVSDMRYIAINKCLDCPHRDHKGGFGQIQYIPVCNIKNKELPYKVSASANGRATAVSGFAIPDWCPLPEMSK